MPKYERNRNALHNMKKMELCVPLEKFLEEQLEITKKEPDTIRAASLIRATLAVLDIWVNRFLHVETDADFFDYDVSDQDTDWILDEGIMVETLLVMLSDLEIIDDVPYWVNTNEQFDKFATQIGDMVLAAEADRTTDE